MKTENLSFYSLFSVFLITISIAAFSNQTSAGDDTVKIVQQIYAEGEATGVNAEIRLNDIPIAQLVENEDVKSFHVEINLVSGNNTLTIIPADKSGSVAARLVAYNLYDFVDGVGGDTVLVVRTKNGETSSITVDLGSERPKWSWQSADIVTDKTSHQEALSFAKSFYRALQQGDTQKIAAALKPVHVDHALLTPSFSAEARDKESADYLPGIISDEIWQWDDIKDIVFRAIPVANGRLYDIRREDGSTLFRTRQKDRFERYTFYSMIGRKDGQWRFYR